MKIWNMNVAERFVVIIHRAENEMIDTERSVKQIEKSRNKISEGDFRQKYKSTKWTKDSVFHKLYRKQ